MSPRTKFILSVIVVIAVALFGLFLLFRVGSVITLWTVFSWTAGNITENIGIHPYLANLIALALAVVATLGIAWSFSWDAQKRTRGLLAIAGCFGVYFLLLYAMMHDARFAPDGTPLLRVSEDEEGNLRTTRLEHDPQTGMPTTPLNPELAQKLDREARNPNVEKLHASTDLAFFNPKTGRSLVWYVKTEQGGYELFNHEGYHPQLGIQLQPVTPDIAQDILRSIESGGDYALGDGLGDLKKKLDSYAAESRKRH